MLVRIVKLTIKEEEVARFEDFFNEVKETVRFQEGCSFLELYKDKDQSNVFFTYSYWDSQESLDTYRKSEVFSEIWPYVKTLFKSRAEAWSVEKVFTLQ